MTFKELFDEEIFKDTFVEVEKFSSEILKSYNEKLKSHRSHADSPKEIFDAVWGNVEFSGGEVQILDSPLLQRLRKIKQLGLAYYVYCGCDYSRFYHTLGVTFLADRMATAINRHEFPEEGKKEYFRAVVRLAGIFHDVGHMFLSHVSEHYFGKSPLYPRSEMISTMLDTFEKKTGKSVALHELLSCMIVTTDAVAELLRIVAVDIDGIDKYSPEDIEVLIEYIACLIVGVPVDCAVLPYSSIINGPIDADKCDYLSRDSHVTRVPVAVDISRITQKLSVVETDEIYKSQLWHDDTGSKEKYYELAMKDSAEKALFQLCIARTIMFDSVYYHHKVLTAETEFRSIINQLANLEKPVFTSFTEILSYTDEDFGYYFFEKLKENRSDSDCSIIEKAYRELMQLYKRNMAKRVVCFMPEYLDGTQSNTEKFFDAVLTAIDTGDEKKLLTHVKEEYIHVMSLLNEKVKSPEEIQIFVIQAPTNIFGHSKIMVPIDLRNGNKRDFKGYNLVSSRETSSSASYIVSDEEERLKIYLALEKVLFKQYNIRLKKESIACGKFDQKDINSTQRKLFLKGYYNDTPCLISNGLLYNYFTDKKAKSLLEKFNGYEGPQGYKLSEDNIKAFFKQIMAAVSDKNNVKQILEDIYTLLKEALFINREYVTQNIPSKLKEIAGTDKNLYIVPLGGLRDSAKHMAYFFNDIAGQEYNIEAEKNLKEILQIEDAKRIIFFDDGSFSGKQLISIMQEYMGVPDRETQEKHVEELSDNEKTALLKREIVFFFLAFNKTNEEMLKQKLAKLGLVNVFFVYVEDMSQKCLTNNAKYKAETRDFLAEVGLGLINSVKMKGGKYKKNWSLERAEQAALGYNDAQQMVFLKSSVPTYTITAFWLEGEYNGMPWIPLFKRTDK